MDFIDDVLFAFERHSSIQGSRELGPRTMSTPIMPIEEPRDFRDLSPNICTVIVVQHRARLNLHPGMIVLAVVALIHQQHSETVPYSVADMRCTTISSAAVSASSCLRVPMDKDGDIIAYSR
jgi:hypothetical protein